MSRAFLSLGSNLGDRKDMLRQAVERISFSSKIISMSDIYETAVEDENSDDSYLNCCIEIETDMESAQLLQFLIETQRQITQRSDEESNYSRKNIDLDLIGFDNEVIRTPKLTLPHPSAFRRAFVMIPLAEINPGWLHPVLNKTALQLATQSYWPGWGTFFAPAKSIKPD